MSYLTLVHYYNTKSLKIQCFLCEKFKKLQEKNDVKIVENEGKKYKISILSVH